MSTLLDLTGDVNDPTATIAIPAAARPAYRVPLTLTNYGTKITRIGGDNGAAIAVGGSGQTWGKRALHHYSKDQPWNDDETMIYIEQRDDTTPTKIILSDATYLPIITSTTHPFLKESYECRWRPGHPSQMITWVRSKQKLKIWDVLTNRIVWEAHIANRDPDFGLISEGTPSNEGRYIVLSSHWSTPLSSGKCDGFVVVDLDRGVVGPLNAFTMPYGTEDGGDIDWCSVGPLGKNVVIKYSSNHRPEYARCFALDPLTLRCKPRAFKAADHPLQMGATKGDYNGWLACMSHADMGVSFAEEMNPIPPQGQDWADAINEVLVGGIRPPAADWVANSANWCSEAETTAQGHYIMQSLTSGRHAHVSRGLTANECGDQHTSARNYKAPGYCLATYESTDGGSHKLRDEMVIWELTYGGAGGCVRLGTTRTNDSTYLGEAHAVPSPSFKKVMFASNWQANANPAFADATDFKSYILEAV